MTTKNINASQISLIYEFSDKYKKNNGIFYTNPVMVRLMLEQLSTNYDNIIIDPCCGTGNFLVVSKERGFKKVFGADKDPYAIEVCAQRIDISNVLCIDTLGNPADVVLNSFGINEKADFVIGNPPYAPIAENVIINSDDMVFLRKLKLFGNNLFVAALMRAFELVKKTGMISYIIPKNFLHVSSYSKFRKEILKNKTIISIVDIGAYFKDVRGEQIIITLKNSEPLSDHRIAFKKFKYNKFVDTVNVLQDFYTDEIIIFYSYEDYTIYKKLSSTYKKLGDFCRGNICRGHSRLETAISGKNLRKFGYKDKVLPKSGSTIFLQNIYSTESGIIGAFGGDYEASETITVITDGSENMCHYILGILHSKLCNFFLYKYCYNNSKLTMHTDAMYLAKIPFVASDNSDIDRVVKIVKNLEITDYLSDQWFELIEELNRLVYSIYNLNEQERSYIENEIKQIQSKRWVKKLL